MIKAKQIHKAIFILSLMMVFSCGSKKTSETKKEQKVWTEVNSKDESKPIARHEAAFVEVSGKFYLLGGRGIKPVSIFNPLTKEWSLGAKPPIELHHFQPVVYQDKVYIIGAMTGKYPAETPVEKIIIYNTLNDSWEEGDLIPSGRLRGSTGNVIKNEIIYVSCGISNGHISGHKTWLDSYNLKTGEWKVLADAPRARDHFQAVEHKGNIYVLAGRRSKAPKQTFTDTEGKVDVYDINSNSWSTVAAEIPTQRAGNMAMLYKNDVLVVGGESINQTKAHNQVEGLSTKTHTWKSYPSLIEGRHGTGAFLFKNVIYIASGCGNRGGSPELQTTEKY